MIGTISPLVQGEPRQWGRSSLLHLVGSVGGGMAIFGLLSYIGASTLTGVPAPARWLGAGLVALLLTFRGVHGLSFPLPQSHRSVPQSWWFDFGPNQASFAYGLVLGTGITTVIPFGAFYLLMVWAMLVANVPYGLMLGGVYGLTRGLPVLLAGLAFARAKRTPAGDSLRAMSMFSDRINRLAAPAQTLNRLLAGAFAGMAMAAAWLVF